MFYLVLHQAAKIAYGKRLYGPFQSEAEAWKFYTGRSDEPSPAEKRNYLDCGISVEKPTATTKAPG